MRTRDESDNAGALISSLAHSTPTNAALPSIRQSDIHLETTLSPSGPVYFQKKALLIGIQYYNSTNSQLDGEDRLDTRAGEQLKGPHFDVQSMRQLLLGKAFRLILILRDQISFCARLLWLRPRRYYCAY